MVIVAITPKALSFLGPAPPEWEGGRVGETEGDRSPSRALHLIWGGEVS